jgi:hypothetical protein
MVTQQYEKQYMLLVAIQIQKRLKIILFPTYQNFELC